MCQFAARPELSTSCTPLGLKSFGEITGFFSGTRDPARPARSGPGRSGQVRPGRSGRLRTAQVSDFPIISSAARNQPRPAGGRPRLPPAEPGCGVTPNQNDPGTGRGGLDPPKGSDSNAPFPGNTGVVGKRERPLVAGRSQNFALLASWEGRIQKSMQNHHFPPHPWHSRNPGKQNLQTAPDRFPFKQAVLVQASHRIPK